MIFDDWNYNEFCKEVFFGDNEMTDLQLAVKMNDEKMFNKRKTTDLISMYIKSRVKD